MIILYNKYFENLDKYFNCIITDSNWSDLSIQDREDVKQEVLFKIHEQNLTDKSQSFLSTMLRNSLRNRIRDKKNEKKKHMQSKIYNKENYKQQEMSYKELLEEFISQMTEQEAEFVVILLKSKNNEEIAKKLNVTQDVVRKRKERLKNKLEYMYCNK